MTFPLLVFNSLTNEKEALTTIEKNHLKIYVCGPTVYDRPHLGNARSIVIYDLWYRLFLQLFSKVTYVRNITDVDDKINDAAKRRNISIQNLTKEITELFYHDIAALNVLSPTHEPKATQHIAEMIAMIQLLLDNKHAYVSANHVVFDVKSYKQYGKLSNRSVDELISGVRIEIADYKRDPLDFVLWKPADAQDDVSSIFDSPWGKGRPGWHIECSAMSLKYLGANFDIHGGGADLKFPHHENEIAQSVCSHPNSSFANYWIHNGFLTVNGEKMSKSLKNFITVKDLLDEGVNGVVIRYFLLSSHYHKPLNYTKKAIDDAKKAIEKFYSLFDLQDIADFKNNTTAEVKSELYEQLLSHLCDDLNSSKAFAILHDWVTKIKQENDLAVKKSLKLQLLQSLDFLGFIDYKLLNNVTQQDVVTVVNLDENYINFQVQLRQQAKQNKDWQLADKIRNDLKAIGVELVDAKDKTDWKLIKS